MPSTNKLSSRIRGNSLLGSRRHLRFSLKTYIAKFLNTFCGITSFGVVTKALAVAIVTIAVLSLLSLAGITTSQSAYATGNTANSNVVNSNTVSANVQGVIAIRILNSEATAEISELNFNLTPTSSGMSATQRAVVDVSTSNPTGYKLYMQSDYQTKDSSGTPTGNYTTNLTHTDTDVTDAIPTAVPGSGGVSADTKVYWNYTNPLTNAGSSNPTPSVIPAYGTPDKIDQYSDTTNSRQTPVDINVSVDTTIVSGTYENQLLFSAVANSDPVAYTINFDTDGGSPAIPTVEQDVSASVNNVALTSTIPTKTGYTFQYWNIESITSTYTDPATNITTTSTLSSNPATPATASCIDQTTGESKSTCNPGDTLRTYANGEDTVTVGLKAIYTINSHTITANTSTGIASTTVSCPTGTGSGSASGSNTCNYGDTVTISATTSTGYHFNNWTVNSGGATPASPTSATTTFTMTDSNVVVTANATINSYTVTINKGTGIGSVTGAGTYNYGSTVNISASPSSGYKFKNWTVNSGGITPASTTSASTTFTMPDNAVTLTATGELDGPTSCATAQPVEPGSAPGTMNMYTQNGIQYVKLKTGSSTSACYTKISQGTATWDNASSKCPSGTGVPTRSEFYALISSAAYGSDGNLYKATGWSGRYWSSSYNSGGDGYFLYVDSSSANVYVYFKATSYNVVCIVRQLAFPPREKISNLDPQQPAV